MNTTKNLGKTMDLVSAWVRGYGQNPSRNLKIYIGENNGYAQGDILDANYVIGLLKEIVATGDIQGAELSTVTSAISTLETKVDTLNNEYVELSADVNEAIEEFYNQLIRKIDGDVAVLESKIEELEAKLYWQDEI